MHRLRRTSRRGRLGGHEHRVRGRTHRPRRAPRQLRLPARARPGRDPSPAPGLLRGALPVHEPRLRHRPPKRGGGGRLAGPPRDGLRRGLRDPAAADPGGGAIQRRRLAHRHDPRQLPQRRALGPGARRGRGPRHAGGRHRPGAQPVGLRGPQGHPAGLAPGAHRPRHREPRPPPPGAGEPVAACQGLQPEHHPARGDRRHPRPDGDGLPPRRRSRAAGLHAAHRHGLPQRGGRAHPGQPQRGRPGRSPRRAQRLLDGAGGHPRSPQGEARGGQRGHRRRRRRRRPDPRALPPRRRPDALVRLLQPRQRPGHPQHDGLQGARGAPPRGREGDERLRSPAGAPGSRIYPTTPWETGRRASLPAGTSRGSPWWTTAARG